MRRAAIFATALLVSAGSLAGQIGYGVNIMSYWRHDLDSAEADENAFAIERVTLDLAGEFEGVGGRLALEVTAPLGPAATSHLRYAYANVGELASGAEVFEFQAGLIPTTYVTWADEHAWPFRFMSASLAELEGAEFVSDLGVAVKADLNDYVDGLGARATVTNGEGYATAEDDPYKSYSVAVEYTPDVGSARGFSGMVYYRGGLDNSSDYVQNRLGAGAAYEYGQKLGISAQYMRCEDDTGPTAGQGWSAAGWLSVVPDRKLMLFLRYDDYDPDIDTDDDAHYLTVVGIGGEIGAFSWSLDYQNATAQALSPTTEDESVYFHTFIRF